MNPNFFFLRSHALKSINERHEISNNVVCAASIRILIRAFASHLNIKLLTEHHLEFLSLKGGCTGLPESTLVKMPHCLKSHVEAQMHFSGFIYRYAGILLTLDGPSCEKTCLWCWLACTSM